MPQGAKEYGVEQTEIYHLMGVFDENRTTGDCVKSKTTMKPASSNNCPVSVRNLNPTLVLPD
jgi:hypothetical protein